MPDHERYAGVSSSHDGIVRLTTLVRALRDAENEVRRAEENLQGAQFRERELAEQQIPDLMEELGVDDITVDGVTYAVDDKLRHSIPKGRKEECLTWLIANGHEASLKDQISVRFDRGELEDADRLVAELAARKLDVGRQLKIEPSTLSSILNTRLEQGEEVPLDMFGAWRQRRVRVKKSRR
jgi:hypothetical protein